MPCRTIGCNAQYGFPILSGPGPLWKLVSAAVEFGKPAESHPQQRAQPPPGFVRATRNGSLAIGCDPYYVVGFNCYTLIEAAAEVNHGTWGLDYSSNGRAIVTAFLDEASLRGMNAVRMWAFSVVSGRPMQIAPGKYDDALAAGVDFVMAEAAARGMKVILVLGDWWTAADGVRKYMYWSRTAWLRWWGQSFFTDWDCMRMYRNHIAWWVRRVNTITGVAYKDDPTLLSWELLNEPRCPGCGSQMRQWVAAMSGHLKSLDPWHLRAIGEEGFWSSDQSALNDGHDPAPGLAAHYTGQDFHEDTALADITHGTQCPDVDRLSTSGHATGRRWALPRPQ